ncbi:transposase [Heyndrickxia acidiproducens]|uniref:transposase n=1 Tax=Heyndrickxia acidiproducens TaxID=1121084 RepID=UPI0003A22A2B|nr:transposase [Heyndrickxia acidiproducens]
MQELYTDITAGEQKRIDILVETKLQGKDTVILIHIEPQSYYQKHFSERMYQYFSLIRQKHRKSVLPIAVFSYPEKTEIPDTYTIQFRNREILHFHYLTLHLVKKNWKDYIKSNNPLAAALLSKMGYTEKERVQVKLEFLRMIARMELDPARMGLIYGFFETYLKLNEEEEAEVMEHIKNLEPEEAEQILHLPNSYFDRGYQKGREEGREEGIKEGIKKGVKKGRLEAVEKVAVKMLQNRMDVSLIAKLTGLSSDEVLKLKQQIKL